VVWPSTLSFKLEQPLFQHTFFLFLFGIFYPPHSCLATGCGRRGMHFPSCKFSLLFLHLKLRNFCKFSLLFLHLKLCNLCKFSLLFSALKLLHLCKYYLLFLHWSFCIFFVPTVFACIQTDPFEAMSLIITLLRSSTFFYLSTLKPPTWRKCPKTWEKPKHSAPQKFPGGQ